MNAAPSFENSILHFAQTQWGVKPMDGIGLKLAEECGEVAGELVKIPEGRGSLQKLDNEIGDVLIVLSQLAALRGTTLEQLRYARFSEITRRAFAQKNSPLAPGSPDTRV